MSDTPTADFGPGLARAESIHGLRLLADFLEGHPDVPVPDIGSACLHTAEARAQFVEGLDAIEVGRSDAMAKDYGYLLRQFGPHTYRAVVRLSEIGETVEVPSTAVEFTPYTPDEIQALATEAVPA